MLIRVAALLLLSLSSFPTFAGTGYEDAIVTGMRMVKCQDPPRRGFVSDFIIGPPGSAGPLANFDCPEYEIESNRVSYRVRPRRDLLLPVGDVVKFRIKKRDLLILTEDANKEMVFTVVEMRLKKDARTLKSTELQVTRDHPRICLTPDGDVGPCSEE